MDDYTHEQHEMLVKALEEYEQNHRQDLTEDEQKSLYELIKDYINLTKQGL